jgi:hypothetical protein
MNECMNEEIHIRTIKCIKDLKSEWINDWLNSNTNKIIESRKKEWNRKKEKKKKEHCTDINEDITGSLTHKWSMGSLVAARTALVVWRFHRACWMTLVQRHGGFWSRWGTWPGSAATSGFHQAAPAMQIDRAAWSPPPPACLGRMLGLRRAGAGSRAQPLLSGDHGPQRGSTVPLKVAAPDRNPWLSGTQQFMLRIALASLLPPLIGSP